MRTNKHPKAPPQRLDKSKLRFEHGYGPKDQNTLYAVHREWSCPVGFLWYDQVLKGLVSIQYIFVHERCRRQGVARWMLTHLQGWYPALTVCTATGNDLSTPWLKACGFKEEKHGWFLRRRKAKA
jgi:GNAT superfamily N-acetyltransferase